VIELAAIPFPLSRLGAGCLSYGGKWNNAPLQPNAVKDARAAVDAALEAGINLFDHADIYCLGKSETAFGQVLADNPGLRDSMVLQTKCGIRLPDTATDESEQYDFSRTHIVAAVEGSLKRLRVTHVDILLLHRPDPLVEPLEVAAAFDELQATGKVLAFGVSNHTAAQISLLRKYLKQPVAVNQIEFSLLHTAAIDGGICAVERALSPVGTAGIIEYCREHDILIQAWGPLAGGRLASTPPPDNKHLCKLREVLVEVAEAHDTRPEIIALSWILRHPAGIQPIIGSRHATRLRQQAQCLDVEITRAEWYKLFIAGRGEFLP
jgi:predicted oxidoreductase